MSQQKQLKAMIIELLSDGEIHSSEEIRELAMQKGIIMDEKSTAVRNAIFQLKKEKFDFKAVERGMYTLKQDDINKHDTNLVSFDQTMEVIDDTIDSLEHFDWIKCTDGELAEARKKIAKLRKMADRVSRLYNNVHKSGSHR